MGESLWVLCALLFLDGATFAFATTPLLLQYGKFHPAWLVAVAGGGASAAGSAVQLLLLRWAMASERRWMKRFAPSRDKLEAAVASHPAASFLAILLARATPLPDAPLKLVAAASGYPIVRYGVAVFLGALPYYYVLALLGRTIKIPSWILFGSGVVLALGLVLDRLRRRGKKKS